VRLEVASRGEAKQVEVVVNDRRVGRAEVGAAVTTLTVPVPGDRVDGFLEVALRAVPRVRWWPVLPRLELSVGRVVVRGAAESAG
jgi:hypothetical protein